MKYFAVFLKRTNETALTASSLDMFIRNITPQPPKGGVMAVKLCIVLRQSPL